MKRLALTLCVGHLLMPITSIFILFESFLHIRVYFVLIFPLDLLYHAIGTTANQITRKMLHIFHSITSNLPIIMLCNALSDHVVA